jgi:hypothetical protein
MPRRKGWGPVESEEQHRPMIKSKMRRACFFSEEGGSGGEQSVGCSTKFQSPRAMQPCHEDTG